MHNNAIHIEVATAADIPALSRLLSLLFAQEAEFTPCDEAQRQGLAQIINHADRGLVLVARQGSDVVGMVTLLFTISTALGGRVALLEDMVVAPAARGQGMGGRLLTRAIEVAGKHECRRINLLTDQDNAAAQRFYARHGFVTSSMTTLRWLKNESP